MTNKIPWWYPDPELLILAGKLDSYKYFIYLLNSEHSLVDISQIHNSGQKV